MRQPTPPSRRAQRGAALIEYTIVTVLGIIVLVAEPNIILELVQALRKAYSSFVYALSLGWV
ncbi:MAG: hypothetical protein ACN6RG_08425 [Stenotrophomonas sp.]|jgi:Flp pilus assembly pilin Flp|uniref:Flp family type IVb pilin n=1 Tax=Stenotrophomonas capsici TaxID=3110230 RepID=A0ABU5UYT7_9GAMM|nr:MULTISPECIES: hypothetical protein [unclassified Stenotrophomonas]MBD9535961.1 hypothetical protein [Stenotrophomonas sp. STM01]MEA5666266.1 hypothetical protein [Stenotrophomonas sp. MH1]